MNEPKNPVKWFEMKMIERDIYSWCQTLNILKTLIEKDSFQDEYIGLINVLSNDIERISAKLFDLLGGEDE